MPSDNICCPHLDHPLIPFSLLTGRDIIDKGQVISRFGAIGSLYVLILTNPFEMGWLEALSPNANTKSVSLRPEEVFHYQFCHGKRFASITSIGQLATKRRKIWNPQK